MKIKFSNDWLLDVSDVSLSEDDKTLTIRLSTTDGFDSIKEMFSDAEACKCMYVVDDSDNVISMYNDYTNLKNMSSNYNGDTNTTTIFVVMTVVGIEAQVVSLNETIKELQEEISSLSAVRENMDLLTQQSDMLLECLLEMSEIVYAG